MGKRADTPSKENHDTESRCGPTSWKCNYRMDGEVRRRGLKFREISGTMSCNLGRTTREECMHLPLRNAAVRRTADRPDRTETLRGNDRALASFNLQQWPALRELVYQSRISFPASVSKLIRDSLQSQRCRVVFRFSISGFPHLYLASTKDDYCVMQHGRVTRGPSVLSRRRLRAGDQAVAHLPKT